MPVQADGAQLGPGREPCDSCCTGPNWDSVSAFVTAEALQLGLGTWLLIALGLVPSCAWAGVGLRLQVVITPDGVAELQGAGRVRAVARALRP